MRCASCSGETPDDKRFCANCGASLASACSSCGAELAAGARFCADCGTPVAPAAAPPAPASPSSTAERRLCSILFVDLVGFTPLDVAITELEAVHLLGPADPVASMAKEAIDILTELEVPVLLERVRTALA